MKRRTMKNVDLRSSLAEKAVNTIRMLAVDAVQKANSGHPGMPMGAADFAFVLWTRHLRFNPKDPSWPGRDRFVLSAGHGSMLLYAMLHLSGYGLSLEEIQNFRQWGSRTPGHPEAGLTPGVETTTGPLGQGFANGVGMAVATRMAAARFNRNGFAPVQNRVYALVSDGDLMEGVSSEAASLAGHLGLFELIYFYDDNRITIEGPTDLAFSEDVARRFEAYQWNVLHTDGHDRESIDEVLARAKEEKKRPTLIIGRTHIARGSPNKQDKASSHGEPLGEEEVKATKENLNWPLEPSFFVPRDVAEIFEARVSFLEEEYCRWREEFRGYRQRDPGFAKEWDTFFGRKIPGGFESRLLAACGKQPMATRAASGSILQLAAQLVPSLCGGSADLAPSTKTLIKDSSSIRRESFDGRNFHFGIREHAMGGILNGLALYGGFIPYGGTFLVFSDYMRPAIRMAALMKNQVVFVFTHDSIFVGEDGPTHQAVEHAAALRAIPGLTVIRPADSGETSVAWAWALESQGGPTALLLTRQKVPALSGSRFAHPSGLRMGAYILSEAKDGRPGIIIMATGSEVHLALELQGELEKMGKSTRVVSFPSMEIFENQPREYQDKVLPPACRKRIAIEAGVTFGWDRYTGLEGIIIGIDRFGVSAPWKVLAEKFGFTVEKILSQIPDSF